MHLAGPRSSTRSRRSRHPDGPSSGCSSLYALCYVPTLALMNAISFHHDRQARRRSSRRSGCSAPSGGSPPAGSWGSWPSRPRAGPLRVAAAASALLGVYAFFLPHTPPQSLGRAVRARDVLGLDALELLKNPLLRGLRPRLAPHLHPPRVLLQLHERIPERGGGRQRRRQDDHGADVRGALHARHAPLLRPPRGEVDAPAGMTAWAARYLPVRLRQRPGAPSPCTTSGSSSTASATTSSS